MLLYTDSAFLVTFPEAVRLFLDPNLRRMERLDHVSYFL